MRITVAAGTRSVEVVVKGAKPSTLRKAERTARRLLRAAEEPPRLQFPFGFTVFSDAQLEAAEQDDAE